MYKTIVTEDDMEAAGNDDKDMIDRYCFEPSLVFVQDSRSLVYQRSPIKTAEEPIDTLIPENRYTRALHRVQKQETRRTRPPERSQLPEQCKELATENASLFGVEIFSAKSLDIARDARKRMEREMKPTPEQSKERVFLGEVSSYGESLPCRIDLSKLIGGKGIPLYLVDRL